MSTIVIARTIALAQRIATSRNSDIAAMAQLMAIKKICAIKKMSGHVKNIKKKCPVVTAKFRPAEAEGRNWCPTVQKKLFCTLMEGFIGIC